jgi:hypothetical protein
MRRTINVDIIGAINDHKLKAHVTGDIEDSTGVGYLEFAYEEIPPLWHPLSYTDPLVLLPGYREMTGALAFRSLNAPGSFTAECTLDFGNGLLLRKGATINVTAGGHTGGYYLLGTARSAYIPNAIGPKHNAPYEYREYLHPGAPGQIIGVGYATWPMTREAAAEGPIAAVVSARYRINGWNGILNGHYVRILEIPDATWDERARTTRAHFNTRVEPLGASI